MRNNSSHWVFGLAPLVSLCVIIFFLLSSSARAELTIDKAFGDVSGWTIGFSQNIGGCLAATKYKDETTIWIGFTGKNNEAYIAFSNPKWQSIQSEAGYDLQILMGRTIWNGKFYGFQRSREKGLYLAGLKAEFLDNIAGSGGIRVFVDRKPVSALSLSGSRDALRTAISCQKTYLEASTGSGGDRSKQEGGSSGTGFFVSTDGYLITNHHVIEGCTNINVLPVGGRSASAYIVSKDKTNDLAILKTSISPDVVPALRSQARLGESNFVFGFPLTGILSASGNFTSGTVTAMTGLGDNSRFLQISAPVQPGNSGGPLIDKFGNVVGVIVAKLDAMNVAAVTNDIPQNVNFAIKSNILLNFLESNNVVPNASAKSRELPPEAIADLAKLFTVRVICE